MVWWWGCGLHLLSDGPMGTPVLHVPSVPLCWLQEQEVCYYFSLMKTLETADLLVDPVPTEDWSSCYCYMWILVTQMWSVIARTKNLTFLTDKLTFLFQILIAASIYFISSIDLIGGINSHPL